VIENGVLLVALALVVREVDVVDGPAVPVAEDGGHGDARLEEGVGGGGVAHAHARRVRRGDGAAHQLVRVRVRVRVRVGVSLVRLRVS